MTPEAALTKLSYILAMSDLSYQEKKQVSKILFILQSTVLVRAFHML